MSCPSPFLLFPCMLYVCFHVVCMVERGNARVFVVQFIPVCCLRCDSKRGSTVQNLARQRSITHKRTRTLALTSPRVLIQKTKQKLETARLGKKKGREKEGGGPGGGATPGQSKRGARAGNSEFLPKTRAQGRSKFRFFSEASYWW